MVSTKRRWGGSFSFNSLRAGSGSPLCSRSNFHVEGDDLNALSPAKPSSLNLNFVLKFELDFMSRPRKTR